jgi:RimJ/RimL family protein N-acetyltransferase
VSARLELLPLDAECLRDSQRRDRASLGRRLGARIPDDWPDSEDLVRKRLAQCEAEPDLAAWLLHALVARQSREMVGHAGFHLRPGHPLYDAYAPGAVELGYTIFPAHRRRGYASEACLALVRAARERGWAERCVASIGVGNAPSLALAAKLGFVPRGAYQDQEDGPEIVFELY